MRNTLYAYFSKAVFSYFRMKMCLQINHLDNGVDYGEISHTAIDTVSRDSVENECDFIEKLFIIAGSTSNTTISMEVQL